jgi:hypothetical protein
MWGCWRRKKRDWERVETMYNCKCGHWQDSSIVLLASSQFIDY